MPPFSSSPTPLPPVGLMCDAQHQRVDDDDEGQRVDQEAQVHRLRFAVAVLLEHAQRQPEEQRPDDARDVELDRVERDRVGEIFLIDERRNERVVGRSAERLRAAGDERQREDVPDLDDVEVHQHRQRRRGAHLDVLRGQERAAAIVAIGEDAADQREEDDRQLLEEGVQPEEERTIGVGRQRHHQPVLRDDLHPGADARRAGANPLDAKIAIGEGGERAPHRSCANRGGRRQRGVAGRGGRFSLDGFGQINVSK
jgi:hypothetical protein